MRRPASPTVGPWAGLRLSGQTSRRYVVQAADAGKDIAFTVTPSAGTALASQPITALASLPLWTNDDGSPVTTESGAPITLDDRVVRWLAPYSASQSRADKLAAAGTTAYGYAVSDADICVTASSLPVSLYAPGTKIVNIWHSGAVQLSLVPDADGYCQGVLPLTGLPNGALWIEARALVDSTGEALATSALYAGSTSFSGAARRPPFPRRRLPPRAGPSYSPTISTGHFRSIAAAPGLPG